MRSSDDYVALIPPANASAPKFVATVAASVAPLAALQALLASLPSVFDIDNAVGLQEDAVGARVGRSRFLPYPLEGLFFSFDDPARGFDKGVWRGPYDTGVGIYRLDDDSYRRLLRSKVIANRWDGTIPGAQAVFDAYFTDPATHVFVEDGGRTVADLFFSFDDPARGFDIGFWKQSTDALNNVALDMAITIGVSGKLPSLIDIGLLAQGAFPVKSSGVSVTYAVTSVDEAPLFGFDMQNEFVSGFDTGAWGVPPDYIAAHAI